MRMKKIYLFILLWSAALSLKATAQSGDVIYLDGEKWVLLTKPIECDSTLRTQLRNFLPENIKDSFVTWRGYTAFWEIRNGYLCLQRLKAHLLDGSDVVYEAKDLRTVFASYYKARKIRASWFSGKIRIGKGEMVRYLGLFEFNMETEQVLTVRNGKVVESWIYHNFRRPGLKLEQPEEIFDDYPSYCIRLKHEGQEEISRRFPWERFPEYLGKRLFFTIHVSEITADGHITGCDVYVVRLGAARVKIKDQDLVAAFKETLKSIYPWEVFFINGKYTVESPYLTIFLEKKYLTAHTTEPCLEAGVPVCYLNVRGDTVIPYGRYRFCQTDTIRNIGFAYEDKPGARIVCLDKNGKQLFYVFSYDNGPDYAEEGLFRILNEEGMMGFADTLGEVVIQPQYKFAFPFKDGKARVTLSGEYRKIPDSDGEHECWGSGEWFYIDRRNTRLVRIP